jgi:PilZ domain-containing protein
MSVKENVTQHKATAKTLYEERRRFQRIRLQVPLFLRGRDVQGEQFLELAKSLDISGLGAMLACPRHLSPNELVTLTIPAPSITASALVPAGMPPIQARVRRQHEAGDIYLVGVEFVKPIS